MAIMTINAKCRLPRLGIAIFTDISLRKFPQYPVNILGNLYPMAQSHNPV